MSPLVLLLGPMASGKTSLCSLLYRALAESSLKPSAILQENRRNSEGYPVELSLIELPGGEKRFLGARQGVSKEGAGAADAGSAMKPFVFEASAFAWASEKIEHALAEGCQVLILDEIGPLEILGQGGLMPALEKAAAAETPALVLSLRPSLEEQLRRRLPDLASKKTLRILLDRSRDENETFFIVQNIIRHCQDKK